MMALIKSGVFPPSFGIIYLCKLNVEEKGYLTSIIIAPPIEQQTQELPIIIKNVKPYLIQSNLFS